MSRPGLYPKSALYSKSTIISAGDREGVGSLLLHQPIKRPRELSSKVPQGVTWGELFVTSVRTPPNTNLRAASHGGRRPGRGEGAAGSPARRGTVLGAQRARAPPAGFQVAQSAGGSRPPGPAPHPAHRSSGAARFGPPLHSPHSGDPRRALRPRWGSPLRFGSAGAPSRERG